MAKLGRLSIDGTKVRAGASKRKAMSCGCMQKAEQQLEDRDVDGCRSGLREVGGQGSPSSSGPSTAIYVSLGCEDEQSVNVARDRYPAKARMQEKLATEEVAGSTGSASGCRRRPTAGSSRRSAFVD